MESPNFTRVQTPKNPQLKSHNSCTRRGAACKCKHPQSSDHRSVPPGAGTTPQHRGGVCSPHTFLSKWRQILLSCVSTADRKHSCHICAAHESPQLDRGAKYAQKLVWPQGKWPFSSLRHSILWWKYRVGRAHLSSQSYFSCWKEWKMALLVLWFHQHLRTCTVKEGRRRESCCRSRAVQSRVRFAWRQACHRPLSLVYHRSSCSTLAALFLQLSAAMMNYRLNTSPLPQHLLVVFILLCCFFQASTL